MKPKQDTKTEADKLVRAIKRATRRKFSAEEKIRMVLAGLRGEDSIAELFRREGLHQNLYYRWSKEFLEAGKKRLAGDAEREASRDDVSELRQKSAQLKAALAEMLQENRLLKKKRARDWGGRYMRYAATEKQEIICTVEKSSLGMTRTLRQLSIPKSTFYHWYDLYLTGRD